jgi:hypothetical protein
MANISTGPLATAMSLIALLLLLSTVGIVEGRGGRRGGKGKGKTNLQFAQVAEFSLISNQVPDNRVSWTTLSRLLLMCYAFCSIVALVERGICCCCDAVKQWRFCLVAVVLLFSVVFLFSEGAGCGVVGWGGSGVGRSFPS